MHRMLISYEETAVIIYSLNKNREIQQINFGEFDMDKGKALAVEFLTPDGEQFLIGFSSGIICFYKAENSSQKPIKSINLKASNIYNMTLTFLNHYTSKVQTLVV